MLDLKMFIVGYLLIGSGVVACYFSMLGKYLPSRTILQQLFGTIGTALIWPYVLIAGYNTVPRLISYTVDTMTAINKIREQATKLLKKEG
jgi:hypothetical protein